MSLERLTSDLLMARHGFFTRRGGASSGIYHGLNCGPGSGDQSEAVRINRTRVAESMGVDAHRLLSLHQVHSADVVVATAAGWDARPKADGVVTDVPGLAISVLTADCAPVLLEDREAGVIGAAHAGWRGAQAGVLEAVLDAMTRLGAETGRVQAAVGPTISQRNYEVGPDLLETFLDDDREAARYFASGATGKYLFDLPGYVLGRLRAAGVAEARWIGACTYADPERFFSYRRTTHAGETDYGRLISAITL